MGASDWLIFLSAIAAFWRGENPYLVGVQHLGFYNPAWTLILLTPFTWLPAPYDLIAMWITSIVVMFAIGIHYKMKPWQIFFLAASPMLLVSMAVGNIDWLPWVGLLIPNPAIAILFLTIKPQSTLGVIMVIVWQQCHDDIMAGDVRNVTIKLARMFGPVMLLLIIQTVLYGVHIPSPDHTANQSMFPYSIPVGLGILGYGLWKKNVRIGAMASPLLSPYTTITGYLSSAFLFPVWSWIICLPFVIMS